MTDVGIGLDIGATKVLGVAVDVTGAVVASARRPTGSGVAGVLQSAHDVVSETAAAVGVPVSETAVGVGVPGLVDVERGLVLHAVNLGAGDELPLRDRLTELLGVPVIVENDVNAAAIGASSLLPSASADLAYLSIGTGLAAGLVLGGQLRRGAFGAAGEIGHLPVDPHGPPCSCGQRGCLEVAASGSALAAAWPAADGVPPAQALFAAAAAGDPVAVAVRDRFAAAVASAVRLLVLTVDVESVVLGGGVAELGDPLRATVADALVQQAAGSPFLASLDLARRLSVVPSGSPVAAIGAAVLGRRVPAPRDAVDGSAAVLPSGGG